LGEEFSRPLDGFKNGIMEDARVTGARGSAPADSVRPRPRVRRRRVVVTGRPGPLVEDLGGIDAVLREHDVAPPALTTDGARSVLKRLTEAAGIDVDAGELHAVSLTGGVNHSLLFLAQSELARDLGFEPLDVGDRSAAVHLENLARLWIHFAIREGNREFAFVHTAR